MPNSVSVLHHGIQGFEKRILHMAAEKYEICLLDISVKNIFHPEKRNSKSLSASGNVMFYLLYNHQ